MMEKGDRYEMIRSLVIWGTIKTFSDIFDYVSKSNIAEYLGKEKNRFTELIQKPWVLEFKNIDKLTALFQLTFNQMAALLVSEQLTEAAKEILGVEDKKDIRYNTIVPLFNDNKIKEFKDIFNYIPRSVVAEDIGKKTARLEEIEDITVMELYMIGKLCELNLVKMFSLAKAQHIKEFVLNTKP